MTKCQNIFLTNKIYFLSNLDIISQLAEPGIIFTHFLITLGHTQVSPTAKLECHHALRPGYNLKSKEQKKCLFLKF